MARAGLEVRAKCRVLLAWLKTRQSVQARVSAAVIEVNIPLQIKERKKQKFKVYQVKTCSAIVFIAKVHKQKHFKNYFGSPRPQIRHSEHAYSPLRHIIPFNYKNSRLSCAGWELYQYRGLDVYFYIVCLGPSSR